MNWGKSLGIGSTTITGIEHMDLSKGKRRSNVTANYLKTLHFGKMYQENIVVKKNTSKRPTITENYS